MLRHICAAQADTFGPDKTGKDMQQTAWQLQSMQEATDFLPEAERNCIQRQLAELLQGILHPDSGKRWTAQQVCELDWLKAAAAEALPPCPSVVAMGIE